MIVLDTNVLSEPLRPSPSAAVIAWLDAQPTTALYTTTLSLAELRFGVRRLPAGKRRDLLGERIESRLIPALQGRVLEFDDAASRSYGSLQADAHGKGRPLPVMDGLIAAICHSRGYALATRNSEDFVGAEIELIDPWDSGAGAP